MFPGGLGPNTLVLIQNLVQVGQIINIISIGMGIFFILVGFLKLKRYGEMRTMMSQQMTLLGPLMYLMIGSFLLYLPTTLQLFTSMIWTNTNPMGPSHGGGLWEWVNAIHVFIRLMGVVGVIRGLSGLATAGTQGQPGKIMKSFMFIIGGVMCIHITGSIQLVESLFGWII